MKSKLEQKIDKELAEIDVVPYVYHIRSYGNGSQRKVIRGFNGITIVDIQHHKISEIGTDVGQAIESLANARMEYGAKIHSAKWVMTELHGLGYHGVAICDHRDDFSRKRGRIIAKGRLLKYLKSIGMYPYELRTIDQEVVGKGRLVGTLGRPELIDGTIW